MCIFSYLTVFFYFLQAEAEGQTNAAAAKKQLRLSYEDYRKIANLVVHYLRKNDNEDIQKSKVGIYTLSLSVETPYSL